MLFKLLLQIGSDATNCCKSKHGASGVETGAVLVSALVGMLVSCSEQSALLTLFQGLRHAVDVFVPWCFVRQGWRSPSHGGAVDVGASSAKSSDATKGFKLHLILQHVMHLASRLGLSKNRG